MPAYVAVDITVNDPATYDRYKLLAPPAIAKYGGKYLVRGGTTTTLEGDWSPTRFVILEFPTGEKATRVVGLAGIRRGQGVAPVMCRHADGAARGSGVRSGDVRELSRAL